YRHNFEKLGCLEVEPGKTDPVLLAVHFRSKNDRDNQQKQYGHRGKHLEVLIHEEFAGHEICHYEDDAVPKYHRCYLPGILMNCVSAGVIVFLFINYIVTVFHYNP